MTATELPPELQDRLERLDRAAHRALDDAERSIAAQENADLEMQIEEIREDRANTLSARIAARRMHQPDKPSGWRT
jgi:CHASE3 domain sensor protein